MAFVHPFDDPDVVAGQGTLGLELLDDVPDLAKVVVPVGGGGLASGVAIAVKSARREVEVVGVQVDTVAAFPESLRRGEPVEVAPGLTIADGIAVKRPGELTLALVRRWLDDVVVVPEDDVAEAMVLLHGEGQARRRGRGRGRRRGAARRPDGAGGAAARRASCSAAATSTPACWRRSRAATRPRRAAGSCVFTRVPDRPGSLARLLALVGEAGANLVDVEHLREGIDLHVRETAVQLVLETRGREHADEVLARVRGAGYEAKVMR